MPAEGNTITASFGVDLTPLKRDFAQAASIARTGAANVATAIKTGMAPADFAARTRTINWSAVAASRGNAPDRTFRTGADFAPAPFGKYPSPAADEEEATTRGRRLLRLFRALTITTVFGETVRVVTDAIKKADDFRAKIAQITTATGSGAFRGIGEMEQSLKASADAFDEIRQKRAFDESAPFRSGVAAVRKRLTGESDTEDLATKNQLRTKANEEIREMARNQDILNKAERESLGGSEETAAILKEQVTHNERLYKLASEEAAAHVTNKAARDEENKRTAIAEEKIRNTFQLKQREVTAEQLLANLAQDKVSTEDQKLAALKSRLRLIEDERNFSQPSIQRQQQLGVEETKTKTAIADVTAERFFNPGAWQQSNVAAALERERRKVIPAGFEPAYPGQSPHLDMSGNLIPSAAYQTSPAAYDQTGGKTTGTPDWQRGLHAALDEVMSKYWGQ